jgi:hypothetical protein
MIERVGSNKINQSEVDWVIRPVGQPAGPPNLKKPTTLRGWLGFGTAKAVITSGAVMVHASTLLASS